MGRTRHLRAILVAAAATAGAGAASADDWKLQAGISAKETYTDNVTLSATNPQSDFITEVSPYLSASKKGARLQAEVSYRMQNLFYADQSSRNRINHQLSGRAKAELWENEVFLDANASISQQITSLLGPIGADTGTATGNLTDVYTAMLSPYWQHRFGSAANLLARYTHTEMRSGNSVSNSTVDGVDLDLSSGSAFRTVSWGLNYRTRETNYTNRSDVSLSRVSGTVGYAVTGKLRLSATAGYDDNDYQTVSGGVPSGSFWNVGASWVPTPRTSVSGSFGERSIGGKTYGLSLDHRTRRTNWHVGYAEDITTYSSQFTVPVTLSTADFLDTLYQNAIPDPVARAQFVQFLIATLGLPQTVTDPLNVLSQLVYLSKRLDASVGFTTAKSTTVLSFFNLSREALESGSAAGTLVGAGAFSSSNTIKQRGFNVSWTWRMSPRLSSTAVFTWNRNTFPDLGRTDNLKLINLGLIRTFNDQLSGSLNLRHQRRDSNSAAGDYDENAVIGSVNYTF